MIARLRARKASIGLALLTLVVAVATGTLLRGPVGALRDAVGLDVEMLFGRGNVASLITSVLVTDGGVELVAVVAVLVLVTGTCEKLLGAKRTLLAYGITAVVGGLGGTALQALGLLARGFWTTPPATQLVLHPATPIAGVLMTASAFCGPLWRRRIRTLGFTGLIVLMLYSGQPTDLDRLVGALAGVALGALMTRSKPRLVWQRSSHHESRSLLAALVGVTAIGPIVAAVRPRGYGLLRPLGLLFRDPLPAPRNFTERCVTVIGSECSRAELLARLNGPGAVVLSVMPLLVLIVAAVGIQRGRRAAAWVAIGMNLLLALLAALYYDLFPLLQDPDQVAPRRTAATLQSVLAVLVPVSIAVAVLLGLHHFVVRPTRRALLVAGLGAGGVAVLASATYVVGGAIVGSQFSPVVTWTDLLYRLPERMVPPGFLRYYRIPFVPDGPVATVLEHWTGPVIWIAVLVAVIGVLMSARRTASVSEHTEVRELLRTGATGSISWMTTWPNNRYWFSADGRHAVAYREGAGVALTVGPPVGAPEGAVDAAREFAVHCDSAGLIPAFYTVPVGFASALGAGGARWATVEVGRDTVIDVAGFSMKGKHWQDVRTSVNRADRMGIGSSWTSWRALSIAERSQIQAISEEWVADKRLPELGFTLGGVTELTDPEVRMMLATGPEGRIEAVTSWLPTWENDEVIGWTLDFMRRREGSPNGVVEFLIASVIGVAQQQGVRFVSLSVAPLDVEVADPDLVQRVLGRLAVALEPAYGFRSLANFKQKFRPEKVPQVLAFPDAVSLPAISIAVARAYLTDSGGARVPSRTEEPLAGLGVGSGA